jgi:uncharacterized protein YyaL (SSP411 family)
MHNQTRQPNRLIHASSPYLLQHAYNPVDWFAWENEALEKARFEDKPILVSIGYSACHWCHVMERECFENEQIAALMNQYFVCIKIDREERPDIDHIYMEALQLMGLQGGWPLNVFLTPDLKPFYGGTYFPPKKWTNILQQIAHGFANHRGQLEESADSFVAELNRSELEKYNLKAGNNDFNEATLNKMYDKLSKRFDIRLGGMDKAPKFPMPCIWEFLMRYAYFTGNTNALAHLKFTLSQIGKGGIYDQIGGGFARYSVDAAWFVPHFEKMLYDNGQLLSLYASAYALTGSTAYKQIIDETISFTARELTTPEGAFYAALDADSQGVEGKFYVWKAEEIDQLLGTEAQLFKQFYNVKSHGNWEEGENILHQTSSNEDFAAHHNIASNIFDVMLKNWKEKLLSERAKRVRPGLDDKVITSWNALMLKGLADAFAVLQDEKYLALALKNADFIATHLLQPDGKLWHSCKIGKTPTIIGYLEDYACVIQGFLAVYQVTFDEKWLQYAKKVTDYSITHFYDHKEEMFFFTDDTAERLIARKKEIFDNVIPASNSIMARAMQQLAVIFEENIYQQITEKMIAKIAPLLEVEVQYLSNWACLYADLVSQPIEVVITGKEAKKYALELRKNYLPNVIILATTEHSTLPLFEGRLTDLTQTYLFVCQNKTCSLPLKSVEEALKLIQ